MNPETISVFQNAPQAAPLGVMTGPLVPVATSATRPALPAPDHRSSTVENVKKEHSMTESATRVVYQMHPTLKMKSAFPAVPTAISWSAKSVNLAPKIV
jgi:hypothetical protein